MRPVLLKMSGFGAFRELEEIDFSDVDYLALVGPTGAGKSTVIDAICFALYGSVPRYDNDNRVGYAVTTGAAEARVSFTFDAGGRRYTATRVVRRRPDGGAQTREARLEVVDGAGTAVLAGSVRELDAAIREQVLGMPFHHFTRCVVLPQGEFARFLSDKPRERQDMLVSLLGLQVYGRMGKRANEIKAFQDGQAAQLRAQAEELAFATPEAAAGERARIERLVALHSTLTGARGGLDHLEGAAAAADAEAARAAEVAARLESLRVPHGVTEAGARLEAARQAHDAARAEVAASSAACTAADEALSRLGERIPLEAALADHALLARLTGEVTAARERHTAAENRAAEAAERAARAARARQEAEHAAEAARAARAAHTLAERLVAGEPCPVCLAVVAHLPHHPPSPDLEAARTTARAARAAADAATAAAADAAGRQAASAEIVAQLEAQQGAVRARLAERPGEAELGARLAALDEAAAVVAAARRADTLARQREREASAAFDRAAAAVEHLRASFEAAREALVALGPPVPARRDVADDWAVLVAWAASEVPNQRKLQAEATAEAGRLRRDARRLVDEAVTACGAAGVSVAADAKEASAAATFAALERAQVAAEASARRDLERIEDAMSRAADLAARAAAATEEATVARELARHLSAKGFERWVLAETMEALVGGASVILGELSRGAYSLATDEAGEFWVIDHRNADERRSAKTLSGGETFQASLALALALADQLSSLAAAGAARIEATFIDEGFGTLDEDTLDTVAGTLENLGGDDRLVGIVTHVRELAERVPVRFEVTKGPRSSHVVKVVT